MSINYPAWFVQQFFDNSGKPLAFGKVYAYGGDLLPAVTYNDNGSPNAFPVVLDASGRAAIRIDSSITYKFEVFTSGDSLIGTYQNVTAGSGGGSGNYLPNSGDNTYSGNLNVTQTLTADNIATDSISLGGQDINDVFVAKTNGTEGHVVKWGVDGTLVDSGIIEDTTTYAGHTYTKMPEGKVQFTSASALQPIIILDSSNSLTHSLKEIAVNGASISERSYSGNRKTTLDETIQDDGFYRISQNSTSGAQATTSYMGGSFQSSISVGNSFNGDYIASNGVIRSQSRFNNGSEISDSVEYVFPDAVVNTRSFSDSVGNSLSVGESITSSQINITHINSNGSSNASHLANNEFYEQQTGGDSTRQNKVNNYENGELRTLVYGGKQSKHDSMINIGTVTEHNSVNDDASKDTLYLGNDTAKKNLVVASTGSIDCEIESGVVSQYIEHSSGRGIEVDVSSSSTNIFIHGDNSSVKYESSLQKVTASYVKFEGHDDHIGVNGEFIGFDENGYMVAKPITTGGEFNEIQMDIAPTALPAMAEGMLRWNTVDHCLDIGLSNGSVLQVGQENQIYVYNGTLSAIPNGSAVYLSGSTGQRVTIELASAANATGDKTIGMTTQDIPSHSYGLVTVSGLVRGLNTNAYTEGDSIYLSATAGQWSNTAPTKPNHQVLIGIVVKKNASDGWVFSAVRAISAVSELSDVVITGIANKDILQYDNVSGTWKNYSVANSDKVSKTDTNDQTIASNLKFSATVGQLTSNTVDGSDTNSVRIGGGGTTSVSRGSAILLFGNEATTFGGSVFISAGDSSAVQGDIIITTNNTEIVRITKAGVIHNKTAEAASLRSVVTAGTTTASAATDRYIVFTGTTTQTYTMPSTVASQARLITVKNRSTGVVTINRAGSDTIDGGTSVTLTKNQSITMIANGTDWVVI